MRAESLVLLCRPGFEKECSAEIIERLAGIGVAAYLSLIHISEPTRPY